MALLEASPITLDHMSVVRRAADECILLLAGILILGALAGMPPRKHCSMCSVAPLAICHSARSIRAHTRHTVSGPQDRPQNGVAA